MESTVFNFRLHFHILLCFKDTLYGHFFLETKSTISLRPDRTFKNKQKLSCFIIKLSFPGGLDSVFDVGSQESFIPRNKDIKTPEHLYVFRRKWVAHVKEMHLPLPCYCAVTNTRPWSRSGISPEPIILFFLNSFYFWVYRLGIAVLPTSPITILILQVFVGR